LDHFIVFGEEHLRYLLQKFLSYHHAHRPHQGIGNVLLAQRDLPDVHVDEAIPGEMVCHESLGGLLKHYERKAAQGDLKVWIDLSGDLKPRSLISLLDSSFLLFASVPALMLRFIATVFRTSPL
jgi:hypothetical protein